MGDVVCSLPAAVALKAAFPDAKVHWIVDGRFADVVRACSAVDEVIEVEPTFRSLNRCVRGEEFDAAIDLQGLFKSAWPVATARAPKKLGYHWQREGSWLFTQRVLPDPSSMHIVDQYVDVARAAGGVMDRASFGLTPSVTNLTTVGAWLKQEDAKDYVIINPGAGWETKRWPPDRFALVTDWLAERQFSVILIGGAGAADAEAAKAVVESSKSKPLNWAGRTSIGELIALVSACKAHVGGDTGSTHISAALGRPSVGLYSITKPERSCPYGQIDRCLYEPGSIRDISVESVSAMLEGILA